MKQMKRPVIASVAALAITGGVLAASVGTAFAAAGPTNWEPDPNSLGYLTLYNSSGQVVTGGTNLNQLFAYAQASTADAAGGTKATLFFATPQNAPTGNWTNAQVSTSAATPPTGAPAPLNTSTTPVATSGSTGANMTNYSTSNPSSGNGANYANYYQVRLETSGGSGGSIGNGQYWEDDILINPTAGTWTEVYGGPVATSVSVAYSENPANQGDTETLTATTAASNGDTIGGTVDFKVDGTDEGTVTETTDGTATKSFSTAGLSTGSHTVTATFTPSGTTTGGLSYATSTYSGTLTVIKADSTTTTLGDSPTPAYTTDTTTFSGTVSDTTTPSNTPTGTVGLFDNGNAITGAGSLPLTGGAYSFNDTSGFPVGTNSITAVYTPTATTPPTWAGSTSSPVTFSITVKPQGTCADTGSNCSDSQGIQAEIPTGTLVISSPYTTTNPLDLGVLGLSSDGTYWHGTGTFKCIVVTDASSGGSPFVASALSSELDQVAGSGNSAQHTTNGATKIDAQNVGLTGLAKSTGSCPNGNAPVETYNKPVSATDNNAALGVAYNSGGSAGLGGSTPHTILTGTSGGEGTATYDGTLTINAPTSTDAGTYTGTILFTVTD